MSQSSTWIGGSLRCGLIALVSLSSWAAAAPAEGVGGPERAMLFVVGEPGAEKQAAQAQAVLGRDLGADGRFRLIDFYAGKKSGSGDSAGYAKARQLYEQGREAYDNLDLDRAVKLFVGAAKAIEGDSQQALDVELYSNLMIYLGAAHVLTGKEKKGRRTFRSLLIVNRKAELNPMIFPPSLVRIFRSEFGRIGNLGRGAAEVSSKPSGAKVFVDGQPAGRTPVTVGDLSEGEHFLHLVARGYDARSARLPITGGAQEMFDLTLEPQPKTARLEKLLAEIDDDVEGESKREVLMQWLKIERLFFVRLSPANSTIRFEGLSAREQESQRLNTAEGMLPAGDPLFSKEIVQLFAPLKEEMGGSELAAGNTGDGQVDGGTDEQPVWKAWWLWTAVGVVVAGGAGLALGLTMGGESTPKAGDVIFHF